MYDALTGHVSLAELLGEKSGPVARCQDELLGRLAMFHPDYHGWCLLKFGRGDFSNDGQGSNEL
eukprot:1340645-Pyramimonas_sp.AAC.1